MGTQFNRTIRVAGLVIPKRPFDREANMFDLEQLAQQAALAGAQLLVTPEGFLEGYLVQTPGLTRERYAEVADDLSGGSYYERICVLAAEYKVHIAAGLTERSGNRFYNTCVLIGLDGSLIGKYRKTHNLNDEPLNTKGNSFPVFETSLGRVGN